MNSSPTTTQAPAADINSQPIDRVRDIRDDLQARITAHLRDLNI